MKRWFGVAAVAAAATTVAMTMTGCGSVMSPAFGSIYTDTKGAVSAGPEATYTKEGEACAEQILFLGQGDASIKTAMDKGGIKRIHSVDYHAKGILGVWGEHCTVVRGN